MSKTLKVAMALILIVAASSFAQNILYYSSMPRVSESYDSILLRTWDGVKKRNVNAFPARMVHRPKSEYPGDAVSEGISYGMYLALYSNDRAAFDSIWNAGERHMWNSGGGFYDWHKNSTGGTGQSAHPNGPASDADQDIALLLIFADELVKAGIWRGGFTSTRGATYAQRARALLETIRNTMINRVGSGNYRGTYLLPGGWGEPGETGGTINPGYFAPAFYRIFAEYEPEHAATWNALVATSYDLIERSPGYARGLLPDWCTIQGTSTGGAGYNAYFAGDAMYRDAIRVYWRLAKDYLWYGEPRAKAFLDNAMKFIESKGGPDAVNFYQMDGSLLPEDDVERLAGGTITRSRREHSHLTAGMWASAAIGTGDMALAEIYSAKLREFYEGGDYWGKAVDPTGGRFIGTGSIVNPHGNGQIPFEVNANVPEDTLRNEMYFDQFLAWFGAALLGGVTTNVWEDLKSGIPTGPPAWKVRPPALLPNWDINASEQPFRLGASFTRAMRWTFELKHTETGEVKTFSDNSDTVNVVWYGLNDANGYMTRGFYDLTITVPGLEAYKAQVWLGRPWAGSIPNLREGNRLIVDDFADGDLIPYIGNSWKTYSDGQNSVAEMKPRAASGNTSGQLEWDYEIRDGAPHPFIALDWDCRTIDLTGVDSIVIVARSRSVSSLTVPVHLIDTDDPNNYRYFADEITLTTTMRAHGLRLSSANFRQRYDGNDKNFNTVISALLGIRFHMQKDYLPEGPSRSDAIIIERMYLVGPNNVLSRIYTPPPPPPDYMAPTGDPWISVAHRANMAARYSIKRSGSTVRITLPGNMAGANAVVVDVKGRVVRRMSVSSNGRLDINARELAKGMYFVEVKKRGVATLRLHLGNVR